MVTSRAIDRMGGVQERASKCAVSHSESAGRNESVQMPVNSLTISAACSSQLFARQKRVDAGSCHR